MKINDLAGVFGGSGGCVCRGRQSEPLFHYPPRRLAAYMPKRDRGFETTLAPPGPFARLAPVRFALEIKAIASRSHLHSVPSRGGNTKAPYCASNSTAAWWALCCRNSQDQLDQRAQAQTAGGQMRAQLGPDSGRYSWALSSVAW